MLLNQLTNQFIFQKVFKFKNQSNMIKSNLKNISLLAVSLLWTGILQAQKSINVSGGDATGTGGSVAYSVGQVVYNTNSSTSGKVSQGVQQAYEIFTLAVEEVKPNISLGIYPNPTVNKLSLQINDYNNEKLTYQLFDLQGRLLSKGQVTSQHTEINTADLPTAVYFLNISNLDRKKIKSFKIIKN